MYTLGHFFTGFITFTSATAAVTLLASCMAEHCIAICKVMIQVSYVEPFIMCVA